MDSFGSSCLHGMGGLGVPSERMRFIAGLPRSGTTLLSSILSQNPAVYLSPQSDLSHFLHMLDQADTESNKLGVLRTEQKNLIRGAMDAFYSGMPDRVVIDKSRRWGAPYFLRLLGEILDEPARILTPVRPLNEVVASFIRKAQENPDTNYIDKHMIAEDFLPYWRKPLDDARVDWLLQSSGMLQAGILSVSSAFRDETAHMFHVYTYADLVDRPEETVRGIYEFLGVENFSHDFELIPSAEAHSDLEVLGIPGFHEVRSTLSRTSPDPEEVLSDYALTRCEIEDFWTPMLKDENRRNHG
jgi:sulfotransferase